MFCARVSFTVFATPVKRGPILKPIFRTRKWNHLWSGKGFFNKQRELASLLFRLGVLYWQAVAAFRREPASGKGGPTLKQSRC